MLSHSVRANTNDNKFVQALKSGFGAFFTCTFCRRAAAISLCALPMTSAFAWDFADTAAVAQQQAQKPFQPKSKNIPAELASLGYDEMRDIRFKRDNALWRAEKLAFEADFFHVGAQGDSIAVFNVTPDGISRVPYDPAQFDFGKNTVSPQQWGEAGRNLGLGGLRIFNALNTPDVKDELVVFLGASYFRALGQGQRYGISARALAVDTVGADAEEFPRFTDFWLQKPVPGATTLTVHALLESPRLTGAYRFEITPGAQTTTAVQARIYLRSENVLTSNDRKPIATLGIAPLSSMFLSGENQPRASDFRPEVHDSDGLMIASGEGEWLWRPLQNPRGKLVTSFAMTTTPKGFGLMQRDRSFASYEDPEARYELRPSVWITPTSDWGRGRIELLQFATPDETHDNVAAYWVPAKAWLPGDVLDFSYTLAWQGADTTQRPPNGHVLQTRRGVGYSRLDAATLARQAHFAIDFDGPALRALPEGAQVQAVVNSSASGRILESLAYRNSANGTWRLKLRIERLEANAPIELRAFLQSIPVAADAPITSPLSSAPVAGSFQNLSHTLSETWTYLITP